MPPEASSKMRMNSSPIALRLASGSVLPASRSKHYKEFWTGTGGKTLTEDNKNAIWAYFDTIIEIVKNYKKIN